MISVQESSPLQYKQTFSNNFSNSISNVTSVGCLASVFLSEDVLHFYSCITILRIVSDRTYFRPYSSVVSMYAFSNRRTFPRISLRFLETFFNIIVNSSTEIIFANRNFTTTKYVNYTGATKFQCVHFKIHHSSHHSNFIYNSIKLKI